MGVEFSSDSDLGGGDPTVCSPWKQGIMGALELGAPVRATFSHQLRDQALEDVKMGVNLCEEKHKPTCFLVEIRLRRLCRLRGGGGGGSGRPRSGSSHAAPVFLLASFGVKSLRVFQVGAPLSPSNGFIKLTNPPNVPEISGSRHERGSWQDIPCQRPPPKDCCVIRSAVSGVRRAAIEPRGQACHF